MKTSCEIIKDLLPLYCDGIASEESARLIEEHLEECDSCREKYHQMKESVITPVKAAEEESKAQPLMDIKRRLRRKRIKVAIISAVGAVVVIFAAIWALHAIQAPVSADEITVLGASDNGLNMQIDAVGWELMSSLPFYITEGDVRQDAVLVSVRRSTWDFMWDSLFKKDVTAPNAMPKEISMEYEELQDITYIYYYVYWGDTEDALERLFPNADSVDYYDDDVGENGEGCYFPMYQIDKEEIDACKDLALLWQKP